MGQELQFLIVTAATIGVIHTLLGPDHYLPFAVMATARRWTFAKTVAVVAVCGLGHVAGSVVLGAVGIAAGAALSEIVALESLRGELAAWLLVGFGLAYAGWGLRSVLRNRPHAHWHAHAGGIVHEHGHVHHGDHLHVHDERPVGAGGQQVRWGGLTPWVLFTIFIFGPCEALVPVLMVPAARGSWWGVALVCVVFGAATIGTMIAAVALILRGLARVSLGRLQPFSHVAAGLALVACGLAIRMGL